MSNSYLMLKFENRRLQEMDDWRYVVFDGNDREMQSGPLISLCPLGSGIRENLLNREVDTLRRELAEAKSEIEYLLGASAGDGS